MKHNGEIKADRAAFSTEDRQKYHTTKSPLTQITKQLDSKQRKFPCNVERALEDLTL